jgi:hypothetical protein
MIADKKSGKKYYNINKLLDFIECVGRVWTAI